MNLKDLREFINSLPIEFDEFDLVFRDIKPCDCDNILCHDIPLSSGGVDENTSEVYLCDTESYKVLMNTNN